MASRVGISFTALLKDFHRGELKLADLDEVHFGCMRSHLFPPIPGKGARFNTRPRHVYAVNGTVTDLGLVPYEVTWLNAKLKHHHGEGGTEVDPGVVPIEPKAFRSWIVFRDWTIQRESAGMVHWSCGNYPELVRKLLREGHRVWYHGWRTLADYPEASYD